MRPPPSVRKRIRFAFLALLVSLVVGALLGEGLLRLYVALRGWTPNCYAASLEMFRPHAELGYDLRPGFELRSGVFQIRVNSLGLRGPEIDSVKGKGTRIAVLGGSSAFGYFVSDGAEAARLLETRLRERGQPVEVLNAGVPGYNLYQTLPRYRQIISPLKPDIVLLYLGWNDLPYIVSTEPRSRRFRVRPVASWWERLLGRSVLYGFVAHRLLGFQPTFAPASLSRVLPTREGEQAFRDNLKSLLQAIRNDGAVPILCAQASAAHPQAEPALIESLSANSELRGPTVLLGEWLHDSLEEFARAEQILFVDAYNAVPPTRRHLGDYIHLTAEGESALADLWLRALSPAPQHAVPVE